MSLSPSTRRTISGACFGLGSVWTVAGAFKLLFGVKLTLFLLPPIDLGRVSPVPALGVALGLFVLAGWIGRTSARESRASITPIPSGDRSETGFRSR